MERLVDAWRVHKFGGSSVADAACFRRVSDILEADPAPRQAVVLSACRGVTDDLLALVDAAERRDPAWIDKLDAICTRHVGLARELLGPAADDYIDGLTADCSDLHGVLQTVQLIRQASRSIREIVAGSGELWSSRLFALFFRQRAGRERPVEWIDSREIIRIQHGALGPAVQWDASRANAASMAGRSGPIYLIAPGFVARDEQGLQTTLGRNGSDYSGAIFGDLLDAAEIIIWTDVDGVLSADPRRAPGATVIDQMSYEEAMELAYFGAKVLHPQTMAPAVAKGIPIWIRNTFAPERAGTLICAKPASGHAVKGITTIDQVALINVEGAGMIGVPGTAQRLFSTLREHQISVILISQASSEHSICFAVPRPEAAVTERIVRQAFESELRHGQIHEVAVATDCSILAVVGDGMAGTPGAAAKVFSALSKAAVNVRAIAQGASERNISVVIEQRDATRALRAVHASFYLSPNTISVGVIGPGLVGSALLEQLASQTARLRRERNLDLRVRGIISSSKMVLSDTGIAVDGNWRALLGAGLEADLNAFEEHIHAEHLPHSLLIDCTASDRVAGFYPRWLASGIHIVTPNKRAGSGPGTLLEQLHQGRRSAGSHFLYEATVGAALPVIQTLRDLRETGDDIRRVEGILSGTLAYLFNVWDGQQPFSTVLGDAIDKGYTEPDARDDLSGMDVARKLIILAREIGLKIELDEVAVEGLVPASLRACTVAEFRSRVSELDAPMQLKLDAARQQGRVLRYVGQLDVASGRASVQLTEMERTHPFANINLTDNVVRFVTGRYDRNPLVIQGPGAGPAVTAGGVFADVLRVCAYLGAGA
ncbi:MAG: bifunctional aspartate kinase/homoserine dehydrogenase I [Vicinamibacterales bacterium]